MEAVEGKTPVKTHSGTFGNVSIVANVYDNTVMLVITELDAFGSIFRVETSKQASGAESLDAEPVFDVQQLLGPRDDILSVVARRLGNVLLTQGERRPLVCCLGLRQQGWELPALRELVAKAGEVAAQALSEQT